MPWQSIKIVPGLDTEQTQSLLEGRYASTSLIRWREGLVEKLGGWQVYYASAFNAVPRELCAWQSLNNTKYLAIADSTNLYALSSSLAALTPQYYNSTLSSLKFTATIGSSAVTIEDSNASNVTAFDTIYIQTPISVGGLILSGPYVIASITSATIYTITAATKATSSVTAGGTAASLTTTSASAYVKVTLTGHGQSAGNQIALGASSTIGGLTISGVYQIANVIDADNFNIIATQTASSSAGPTAISAVITYNIGIGPVGGATGYGVAGYGVGGYGAGITASQLTGSNVTASDWTIINWGEDLIACPQGGGIYYWGPESGNQTALPVPNAPPYNNGILLAMPQLVLVAWGSTSTLSLGCTQDPLLVKWCTPGDFTNWEVSNQTLAGDFRLSRGSKIMGGFQSTFRTLLWTDVECWAMDWIGYPYAFQFVSVGKNCGLIARGAVAELGGVVFWMGSSNFYVLAGGGVSPLPCTVYDAVFQDLDTTNAWKIKAGVTAGFNEVWFFYPSISGGTGENDKYVKYNIVEKAWDNGVLPRSAWISESILGTPIGASSVDKMLYQHEVGYGAGSSAMSSSWGTGWVSVAEGEQIPFIDFLMPDLRFGLLKGAQNASVQITLQGCNYLSDTPTTYGPYTVDHTTQYVPLRIRNRFISIQQADSGTAFWRLGRPRFRIAPSGRV
jgi:hypothetical protein